MPKHLGINNWVSADRFGTLGSMKTGRPKLKLAMEPELLNEVKKLHRKTKDVRTRERAQAVLLAAGGHHTYEQIAQAVGRSRSTAQRWIERFEQEGVPFFSSRQGWGGGRPTPNQQTVVQTAKEKNHEN